MADAQLAEITGLSLPDAQFYLNRTGGDVAAAVELYFQDPTRHTRPPTPPNPHRAHPAADMSSSLFSMFSEMRENARLGRQASGSGPVGASPPAGSGLNSPGSLGVDWLAASISSPGAPVRACLLYTSPSPRDRG